MAVSIPPPHQATQPRVTDVDVPAGRHSLFSGSAPLDGGPGTMAKIARGCFILLLLACPPALATPQDGSHAVEAALVEFLDAFTRLDWPRFRACFTPDASVFLFSAPERTTVEASFTPLFERIRQRASSGPPYFTLHPTDTRIRVDGNVALVTFHLRGMAMTPGQVGQRTLVMQRQGDAWKIEHLHASMVPEAAPDAAPAADTTPPLTPGSTRSPRRLWSSRATGSA